jgi:hypothetical protein
MELKISNSENVNFQAAGIKNTNHAINLKSSETALMMTAPYLTSSATRENTC